MLSAFLALSCVTGYSAVLLPETKATFTTSNGTPLAGGKIYTYIAGTTTPKVTYTDSTQVTANPNPVILDSRGQANIWLRANEAYKIVVQNSAGVVQWTTDNIIVSGSSAAYIPNTGGTATGAYTFDYTGVSTVPAIKFTHSDVRLNTDPYGTSSFIVDATGQNNNQPLQINRKVINDGTFGNGANLVLQNTGGTGVTTSSAFQTDLELVANNTTLNGTVPENGKYEIHVTSGRDTGDTNKRHGYMAVAPRRSDLHPSGRNTGFDPTYYFLPASTVGHGLFQSYGSGAEFIPKYDYGVDSKINLITPFRNANLQIETTALNNDANFYLKSNTGGASGDWHLQSNGTSGRFQIRDQANGDVSVMDISAVDDGLTSFFQRSDNTIGRIRLGNTSPSKIISVGSGNTYNFAGSNGVYLTTQGNRYVDVSHVELVTPADGGTTTATPLGTMHRILFNNSGTIATHTFTVPTTPVRGQQECISARSAVTTLTVNSADGTATFFNMPTTLTAGQTACMMYYDTGNSWWRTQ